MTIETQIVDLFREVLGGAEVVTVSGRTALLNLRRLHFQQSVEPVLSQVLANVPRSSSRSMVLQMVHDFFSMAFEILYHCKTSEIIPLKLCPKNSLPFWVADQFYFMKTTPELRPLEVKVEDVAFRFDTSRVEETIEAVPQLSYSFEEVKQGVVHIGVTKSRRVWKGIHRLTREIRDAGLAVTKHVVSQAIRILEQQFQVDYFLAKDPAGLLLQLLQVWYADKKSMVSSQEDIDVIKAFKDVIHSVIDIIAPFEQGLTRLWEEPKAVGSTHYVITLDKISVKSSEILASLFRHQGMTQQFHEWCDLGLVPPETSLDTIQTALSSGPPHLGAQYVHLPLDTRYFPDLEPSISGLFESDDELDGWLIHSDNFQALNTLYARFQGAVKTIYVDPPFNKDYNAGFSYSVNYSDSAWVTLLDNRFRIARGFLCSDGSMLVRCDSSGNMYVRLLMDDIFGRGNFRNEIHVRRFRKNVTTQVIRKLPAGLDTIFVYAKSDVFAYVNPVRPREKVRKGFWRHMNDSSGAGTPKTFFGRTIAPPVGKHWKYSQRRIDKMIEEGRLVLQCGQCGYIHTRDDGQWVGCPKCGADDPVPRYWVNEKNVDVLDSNWSDIYGYSTTWGFQTENSEPLLQRIIETTSHVGDLVMDFFLGSGTTVAVAHKLRRRWIGIEMGNHFFTTVLPRMKQVLAGEQSGISSEISWRGGGSFKYCSLEQYWDLVRKSDLDQLLK
ncbi:MAG: site-specific DNA-methyltransferase [Candidatus Thorarchaeota archaeon]